MFVIGPAVHISTSFTWSDLGQRTLYLHYLTSSVQSHILGSLQGIFSRRALPIWYSQLRAHLVLLPSKPLFLTEILSVTGVTSLLSPGDRLNKSYQPVPLHPAVLSTLPGFQYFKFLFVTVHLP